MTDIADMLVRRPSYASVVSVAEWAMAVASRLVHTLFFFLTFVIIIMLPHFKGENSNDAVYKLTLVTGLRI